MDVTALTTLLPRISQPIPDHRRRRQAGTGRPGRDRTASSGFSCRRRRGIPVCVEDLMADIAVIFSFTLTELSALSLSELIQWRERAYERSGAQQ
jgi:hypothetical protein